LQLENYL